MAQPLIGVTCSRLDDGVDGVRATYTENIRSAGAIPVLLPNVLQGASEQMLDKLDGLMFTGGPDLNPRHFGEAPHPNMGHITPERDRFELELARAAISRKTPVLGICRGIQLLAVAAGGAVIQDIRHQVPAAHAHYQKAPREEPFHEVTVTQGSRLHHITTERTLWVNSFHHQAVAEPVPAAWTVTGRSPDGLVEAIEDPSLPFFLAVQWHPEGMVDAASKALFSALVDAATVSAGARV